MLVCFLCVCLCPMIDALRVRQVLTLAINIVAQKKEATMKSCEDVAGARRTQPPVDCL
jgi:hypothetical protein